MHSLRIGTGFAQYCFPSTVTQLQAGWAHFVVAFIKTPYFEYAQIIHYLGVGVPFFLRAALHTITASALWTMLLRGERPDGDGGRDGVAVTGRGRLALLPRRSP